MQTFFSCCRPRVRDPQLHENLLLLTPAPTHESKAATLVPEPQEVARLSPLVSTDETEEDHAPAFAPPNSPFLYPRTYATTGNKLNKVLDYFMRHAKSPITIFTYLQLNRLIIAPLKEGNYDLACKNFCSFCQSKPELFHYICTKMEILTEDIYPENKSPFSI